MCLILYRLDHPISSDGGSAQGLCKIFRHNGLMMITVHRDQIAILEDFIQQAALSNTYIMNKGIVETSGTTSMSLMVLF